MNTYQTLTLAANKYEELIAVLERARDSTDFLLERLPSCILELEGAYRLTNHWLRYRQPFDELSPHAQWWLRTSDAEQCTGVYHIDIEGETVFLEFGVSEEEWCGQQED